MNEGFGMLTLFSFLVMMGLGGGTASHDLLCLVDTEQYFQARNIPLQADRLAELAAKDPRDAKTQIVQLLAIRWFGEHHEAVLKSSAIRRTLEQIATGKQAQDRQGFARAYAALALARLDAKPLPAPVMAEGSLRGEAVAWLPRGVTFLVGLDLRPPSEVQPADDQVMRSLFTALTPPLEREEIYKFAETVGNLRLDRVVIGYAAEHDGMKPRYYMRCTGVGNQHWLAGSLPGGAGRAVVLEKGPGGRPMIVLAPVNNVLAAFALVGDTDLVISGEEAIPGKQVEVLRETLKVWTTGKNGVWLGPLAGLLNDVPARASGLALGDLPASLRQELAGTSVLPTIPRRVAADLVKGRGLTFRFRAEFDLADEAKAFAETATALIKQAVALLQNLPPDIKVKPGSLRQITRALESIRPEASGTAVTGTLRLSPPTLAIVQQVATDWIRSAAKADQQHRPP